MCWEIEGFYQLQSLALLPEFDMYQTYDISRPDSEVQNVQFLRLNQPLKRTCDIFEAITDISFDM